MRRATWTLVVLTAIATAAPSLEVGATFDLSNLDFSRSRPSTATTLPGDTYLWGVSASVTQQLSDQLSLDLLYTSDPVLRNVGYTIITYNDQFFSIALGPFFGILNAPSTILQSGLSTTVRIFIPGIASLSLRSDNSLSGRLVVAGDYIQERSELAFGFFVPNAIPTVYLRTERYSWKTTTGEAVDARTDYGIRTDIFQKNIPYGIVLDFAYQYGSRSFVDSTTTVHGYGALVIGTRLTLDLLDVIQLRANLDSSIYTFGTDALLGQVTADKFLFRLSVGAAYRL